MFGQSNSDSLPAYIKPNNQNITVTPTVTQQVFTADQDHTGLGTVTVNAVTSSIDQNITSGNIKNGVSILGVTGNATVLNGDTLSVTPSTSAQILTPTSPKNGFTQVSVSAVTSTIDQNITSENIKKDVTILGVTGDYEGSGGGDVITAINNTGAAVLEGDKVWINQENGENKLVNYYNSIPNLDIVGSPTISSDCIVNKFSQTNYLKSQNTFNPGNNSWEISLKFITSSSISTDQNIFQLNKTNSSDIGIDIGIFNHGKFEWGFSFDGSSWSQNIDGTHNVLPNTIYYLKLGWDCEKYYLDYKKENDTQYTRDIEYISSIPVFAPLTYNYIGAYFNGNTMIQPFLGSVDLKETYIKINDEKIWEGYKEQIIAPISAQTGTAAENIAAGSTGLVNVGAVIEPVVETLNVTPTTSAQTITPTSGVDGYAPITVSAVDSTIDQNIVAGNIKKDVTILGVTGDYEGSGGGDEIEVMNWSGNTLNVGDKVWISPMYLGTEADFRQISTNNDPWSPTVHVSRDGTTVYYTYNGILYNTTTDTSVTINSINQSTSSGYSCVNYSRCGDVIYSVVDNNWVVEGSGIGVSTNYAFLGNNYYYNYNTNKYVKMIDNTKIEDKEYTLNNVVFYTSYGYAPYTFSVAKNYLYYCGSNSNTQRISKAYIDDENLTITYVSELFNTNKRIPWTTYDENYVFVGTCGTDYGNRRWYNLQIYKVENNGDLSEINILEMCPDLTPFYNNVTAFRYNYLDDILTVGTANNIATFKYSNGKFLKLSDYTFSSSMNDSCQISSSSDGKILAYKGNQYYTPYCVKLQGNSEYKIVTYNNINISSSSLTGYVTEGGANGELVKIQTVLPEKINVLITANADNAEIIGGIN